MLIDRGFTLVRPLAGGIDGWEKAGYQVESEPLIPITATRIPRPPVAPAPKDSAGGSA
jgi:3-mercaptopyruvate sulfurtransferase SseA